MTPTSPPKAAIPALLSIRAVAGILGLSPRAIYRLVARGELSRPVKVGGATRFFTSDVSGYLDGLRASRR